MKALTHGGEANHWPATFHGSKSLGLLNRRKAHNGAGRMSHRCSKQIIALPHGVVHGKPRYLSRIWSLEKIPGSDWSGAKCEEQSDSTTND